LPANQSIESGGKLYQLEVFSRIEVIIPRLVNHSQLAVFLGIRIR